MERACLIGPADNGEPLFELLRRIGVFADGDAKAEMRRQSSWKMVIVDGQLIAIGKQKPGFPRTIDPAGEHESRAPACVLFRCGDGAGAGLEKSKAPIAGNTSFMKGDGFTSFASS